LLRHKPILTQEDERYVHPTFTIPEAAQSLAIDEWKLLSWYSGKAPLLVPSGWYRSGSIALLSFRDVEEAYKVHLLHTKFNFSFQSIRRFMRNARHETGSEHPLTLPDQEILVFGSLVLRTKGRGRRKPQVMSLDGTPSFYIAEVVKQWGKRIVSNRKKHQYQIFPWRYAKDDDRTRPVVMDPTVMSGRLVVKGTRIPVNILWGRKRSGESLKYLAQDYGIKFDLVQNALRHLDKEAA